MTSKKPESLPEEESRSTGRARQVFSGPCPTCGHDVFMDHNPGDVCFECPDRKCQEVDGEHGKHCQCPECSSDDLRDELIEQKGEGR